MENYIDVYISYLFLCGKPSNISGLKERKFIYFTVSVRSGALEWLSCIVLAQVFS